MPMALCREHCDAQPAPPLPDNPMNNSIMRLRIAAVPALETLESRTFLSAAQQPGTIDPSFGNNGAIYLTTQRPEDVRTVAAVAMPDGKMLLLGQLPIPTGFLLARVN